MARLEPQIEENQGSAIWVDMDARFTNTEGTPLVSIAPNGSGEAVAGVYIITFDDVAAGDVATASVVSSSPNNPNNTSGVRPAVEVALDNATLHANVLGGYDLKFSDDMDFDDTWEIEIRIGHDFGPMAAFGAEAGEPSDSRKIRVENTGTGPGQACKVQVIKRVKTYRKSGVVFDEVSEFSADATEKLSDDQVVKYAITVLNKAGSGGSLTADIKVDGALVTVLNLASEVEDDSTGLNVNDTYRITSGGLSGVEFKLSQSATNAALASILVFNERFTQTAPDVGGAPGDWGDVDIDLTEDGQSTGIITAGGFAFFHIRMLVPDGSDIGANSNPYPGDVLITGLATNAAGWAD
jgi:hypothetical protein